MFNNFYGIYKNARDASWQFLIDYHIDRLPVENRYTIAHELGHIYLEHPMINGKYFRRSSTNESRKNGSAL